MLSIGAMGAGQGNYYLDLAREDYYLEGGEPPGHWEGHGAGELGLTGTVGRDALRNLLIGVSPEGDRPLIQNAGVADHQPGWDLTFSAPKSVSALWAVADFDMRQVIQEAHHQAVTRALEYLQEEAAFTRRGKGGAEREHIGLVAATFEHGTSRALDPQLHTHALLLNVGTRRDGTTGTIESKPFYEHKMTAGALYRAELSAELERRLGLECERRHSWFEIKGVPEGLTEEFSKRRAEIETFLEERGIRGAAASAYATLATRDVKGHAARSELFPKWQEVGNAHSFTHEDACNLLREPPARNVEAAKEEVVRAALGKVTAHANHFSPKELLRTAAEEAQGEGIGALAIRAGVKDALTRSGDLVSLGRAGDETRYTTREVEQLSERVRRALERSGERHKHRLFLPSVWAGIRVAQRQDKTRMNEEQRNTLHEITRGTGTIKLVDGMTGQEKTTLLKAARISWEREGYRVIGSASTGRGTAGLQQDTGIKSLMLPGLLHLLDRGPLDNLKHHVRQLVRAALNKPTFSPSPLLDKNTVVILDSAQKVGLRDMARLMEAVEKSGGKLILVDDGHQKREGDERKPPQRLMSQALETLAEKRLLTVTDRQEEAYARCLEDWKREGVSRPRENLLIAGTSREAALLNERAQEIRKEQGELGALSVEANGERFYSGDRIQFSKTAGVYGVKNGSMGTVTLVEPLSRNLVICLDEGRYVTVPLRRFDAVQLGYAVSATKGPGALIENAYFLFEGTHQESAFIGEQDARTRKDMRVYTYRSAIGEAGLLSIGEAAPSRQSTRQPEEDYPIQQRLHLP